ncbi:MAG: hypothetical protein KDA78_18855, partial [Planctomycetaceae bacterium]|nr:hypothetical protein [Planctomycetaceae bacterium]
TYSVSYRSDLRDFELTGKLANINSRIKLGVGWRHVDFNELMASSFTGTFRAVDNAVGANGGLSHAALTDVNGGNLTLISGAADGFDDETGLLGGVGPDLIRMDENVNAQNQLDGVQFTLDALVMESERYLIETILKVGVFNNNAEASLVETYSGIGNDNSVYSRTLADTSNNVAFVGQITLGGMYRVNDHFRLRAGWDVLFLSGLALAPEQAVLAGNTLILNNEGTAIVNGGHLGVEYVY